VSHTLGQPDNGHTTGFYQGVSAENERIVKVLTDNHLLHALELVTGETQNPMSPSTHNDRKIMTRSQQHYIDGLADGFDRAIKTVMDFSNSIYDTKAIFSQDQFNYSDTKKQLEFALNTLEALRDQLEDTSDIGLDIAAKTFKPTDLTDLTEDEWSEIDTADDLTKSLLQLISRYKSEGYVAVTLDKVARLVIGGHAGFIFGEE
jgi:S-adenosylmethionine:tRNA-ribosyltransferase-isomerase (queuine synthetase)